MTAHSPAVFVVDDNDGVRGSIRALLESAGHRVLDYPSAEKFLAGEIIQGGCLIADIRMPEMSGLDLQEEIVRRGLNLPVIIITGHGDVPLAVRAMKAGAVDFIEKPFDDETMLQSLKRALEAGHQARNRSAETQAAQKLLSVLTPREQQVLEQLTAGRSNKVAAHALGISPRTIEIHRAHVMDKLKAKSLSDLVRISLQAANPGTSQ
jgi:two-component system response regulator FixJ